MWQYLVISMMDDRTLGLSLLVRLPLVLSESSYNRALNPDLGMQDMTGY